MALILSITKSPPGQAPATPSKTIGAEGCLIGRGSDNNWILADPDRFLSSKHCQISCEAGKYYLIDTSTNGTFLNGAAEPLGRGARAALSAGDTFDLGDYRFEVSLSDAGSDADFPSASSAALSDPFGSSPFADDGDFLSGGAGFGDNTPSATDMFGGAPSTGLGDLVSDAGADNLDPLAALDGLSGQAQAPVKGVDQDLGPFPGSSSQNESFDVMSESAAWPGTQQDASLLPDDWDDDLSILNARKPQRSPFQLPDDDSLIVSKPATPVPGSQAKPARAATPAPGRRSAPAGRHERAPAVPQSAPTAPPRSTHPSEASAQSGSGRRFVDALGFEGQSLTDEQIEDIELTSAEMMRETIEGLMQVLRSRSSIKNEFRMNVTTIQPVENNPLKFSANADEVLDIMFMRNKNRAYKEPVDAVKESFHTIADHQVAVIAGIRSAFRSVMAKFDPLLLEETFAQTAKGGLIPSMGKGKYWSTYQEHYQKVVNNMESSFQELFGDEFVQAYEDQLRKLSDARRRNG